MYRKLVSVAAIVIHFLATPAAYADQSQNSYSEAFSIVREYASNFLHFDIRRNVDMTHSIQLDQFADRLSALRNADSRRQQLLESRLLPEKIELGRPTTFAVAGRLEVLLVPGKITYPGFPANLEDKVTYIAARDGDEWKVVDSSCWDGSAVNASFPLVSADQYAQVAQENFIAIEVIKGHQ